jgi:hypothetical protein
MIKQWITEDYTNEKGYTVYKDALYIDGNRTNRRRKEVYDKSVYDKSVCSNDEKDIKIKDFLYEFRAFVDNEHFICSIGEGDEIGIFHYKEYTEDE